MEENKTVVTNENFDWNAFENDLGVYSQPKEEIAAAYDKTLSNVAVGEVVEGTVMSIGKREVVVNIGYKSEGVIPVSEFRYNPELAVGEKVEVYVESAEDKNGQLSLSHKKARQLKSWDRVNEALANDEIIKGYIKCRTKGGMIVDVFGIEAFLPGSQIDVKPIRDYDVYVDIDFCLCAPRRVALEQGGQIGRKLMGVMPDCVKAVSYTHLDVYKRQPLPRNKGASFPHALRCLPAGNAFPALRAIFDTI